MIQVEPADPEGDAALALLREATLEARRLYSDSVDASAPLPGNRSTWKAAAQLKFNALRLETGNRQLAAMKLYESCGVVRIPAFGPYSNDSTSVCYEKRVGTR